MNNNKYFLKFVNYLFDYRIFIIVFIVFLMQLAAVRGYSLPPYG